MTVRKDNPAPEAFATVRVPNESDVATTRIEVQLPDVLAASAYQPVPGWDISIDGAVMTISGGEIEPGQFQEFSFSGQNPERDTELSFPAVQTYADGEQVRWVGPPDSDKPASVVAIGGEPSSHDAGQDAGQEQAGGAAFIRARKA